MLEEMQGQRLRIYTLGTSTRSFEEFLAILKHYGIKQVIDVRSFPKSKRYPHFDREELAEKLPFYGILYWWLGPELGGYRRGGYEAYMQTEAFAKGLTRLIEKAKSKPTVIICAERFPWKCHRRFIAQRLEEKGIEVIHILDKERTWPKSSHRQLLLELDRQ